MISTTQTNVAPSRRIHLVPTCEDSLAILTNMCPLSRVRRTARLNLTRASTELFSTSVDRVVRAGPLRVTANERAIDRHAAVRSRALLASIPVDRFSQSFGQGRARAPA